MTVTGDKLDHLRRGHKAGSAVGQWIQLHPFTVEVFLLINWHPKETRWLIMVFHVLIIRYGKTLPGSILVFLVRPVLRQGILAKPARPLIPSLLLPMSKLTLNTRQIVDCTDTFALESLWRARSHPSGNFCS